MFIVVEKGSHYLIKDYYCYYIIHTRIIICNFPSLSTFQLNCVDCISQCCIVTLGIMQVSSMNKGY